MDVKSMIGQILGFFRRESVIVSEKEGSYVDIGKKPHHGDPKKLTQLLHNIVVPQGWQYFGGSITRKMNGTYEGGIRYIDRKKNKMIFYRVDNQGRWYESEKFKV